MAAAKPCLACGHNKGQHTPNGCGVAGCPCPGYDGVTTPAVAPDREAQPADHVPAPTSVAVVVERHRAAVANHETLDDVRKIYALSILDSILTELRG